MTAPSASAEFARKFRAREPLVGYWVMLDSPASTERLARVGYDYICLDQQHGLMGYDGLLRGLMAVDAGARLGSVDTVGIVRAAANDITWMGQALDAGASAIIVPLVDSAADARLAVQNAKYPPLGRRSFGPMRAQLRVGRSTEVPNRDVLVLAMIETADGLANVEKIAAVEGLDGLYVGPSDLSLGLGAAFPGDPAISDEFDAALEKIKAAGRAAGKSVGIHTPSGDVAAKRLAEGFDVVTVAGDVVHLEEIAAAHLRSVRD